MTGTYLGLVIMDDGTLPGFEAWFMRNCLEKYGPKREALARNTGIYPKDVDSWRRKVKCYTEEQREAVLKRIGEKPLPFRDFVFGKEETDDDLDEL